LYKGVIEDGEMAQVWKGLQYLDEFLKPVIPQFVGNERK
jgi:hypothetical protein